MHGRNFVSRPTRLRLYLLLIPLALQVILVRLSEYWITNWPHLQARLSTLLWANALAPFLLGVAGYLALRRRWPRVLPLAHWLLAAIVTVTLLCVSAHVLPEHMRRWWMPGAFELMRWDLLFILILALASVGLLEHLRGRWHRASLVALHLVTLGLMLFSALEFSYFLSTGALGDWELILHGLRNAWELAPLLASEISTAKLLLLAAPFFLVLLPPWLEKQISTLGARPQRRAWARHPRRRMRWQGVLSLSPLVLVVLLVPRQPLAIDYLDSSFFSLVQHLVASPTEAALDGVDLSEAPFALDHLRLVATDSTRQMNIVVILLESVRYRSTTLGDSTLPTTPFLASLAERSLRIDQMYSVVSYTNKTIPSVFAGIYPKPGPEIATSVLGQMPGTGLPTLLRPHGYRSAFFSAATLEFERKDRILQNLGFEHTQGADDYAAVAFTPKAYFGYEDLVVLEPSLAWLDEVTEANQPFFLSYLTLTAHHPYDTPPDFSKQSYVQDEALNDYLNSIRYTDGFVRDLFAAFEARGLLESTLFILLGDHGEAFSEHGFSMHGSVWDEALHVPALLYNPVLFPEGGRIQGPRQHIDVLPTVAEALNMQLVDGTYPGRSLLQPPVPGRPLYHIGLSGKGSMALRRDSLKFIFHHRRRRMQVFNIDRDPLEQHDITNQFSDDVLRAAELELVMWRERVRQIYRVQEEQSNSGALATSER